MENKSSAQPATFSVKDAARVLGVSPATVRAEIFAGRLPHFRIGKRVLIPRQCLDVMLHAGPPKDKGIGHE